MAKKADMCVLCGKIVPVQYRVYDRGKDPRILHLIEDHDMPSWTGSPITTYFVKINDRAKKTKRNAKFRLQQKLF